MMGMSARVFLEPWLSNRLSNVMDRLILSNEPATGFGGLIER